MVGYTGEDDWDGWLNEELQMALSKDIPHDTAYGALKEHNKEARYLK